VPKLRFFWDYMNEQTERIRRVVGVLRRLRIPYALIGGHAASYHGRPRVTVDVDFLVAGKSLPRLEAALPEEGFVVRRRGEVLSAWEKGQDPAADEPVVDLVPAEYNRTQEEALRTAEQVRYQKILLRVVTRPAVVALKYLSAVSPHRAAPDKAQDVADLGHIVKQSWTPADQVEARRLVDLSNPGLSRDLDRLIDDLVHDRPITI